MPVYSPALPLTSSLQERFGKGGRGRKLPVSKKRLIRPGVGGEGGTHCNVRLQAPICLAYSAKRKKLELARCIQKSVRHSRGPGRFFTYISRKNGFLYFWYVDRPYSHVRFPATKSSWSILSTIAQITRGHPNATNLAIT